jgi:hypothetical protein
MSASQVPAAMRAGATGRGRSPDALTSLRPVPDPVAGAAEETGPYDDAHRDEAEAGAAAVEAHPVERPFPDSGAPEPAGAPPALPTRRRQASLAAQLRDAPPAESAEPAHEPSAEEMRSIFGAFQRGLDRGRKGQPLDPASPADARRPRTTDEGTDDDA